MNVSYWEIETYFNHVDLTIIGSGIVGLTAAIETKKKHPNLKVIVLERGTLPLGASTKNAGFSCFGSVSELLSDLKKTSENEVGILLEKRWKGLQKLRQTIGDLPMDYFQHGGYEIFNDEEFYVECESKIPYLNDVMKRQLGLNEVYRTAHHKIKEFGFSKVPFIIENSYEGQINTGKMMIRLIQIAQQLGVIILNALEVESIQETQNHVTIQLTNGLDFNTKKIIIATNGFAKQLLPELDVQPARAQVLITEPIPNLKIQGTFHYDEGYYYFRNIDQRILLGGARNADFKGEETYTMEVTTMIQNKLEELLSTVILPNQPYEIAHRWSGIMGVGETKTTIVKQISENVFCSVRMGGMGVAIGSLIGSEVAELVYGS
jgi:gamma-glutamylputrescine oxidase